MILTDTRVIKRQNEMYDELDHLCFLSKNLYNATLYVARQSFIEGNYRNYYSINKEFTKTNHPDYRALPAKVSRQTQMLVDQNFKSFFALCRKKKATNDNNLRPKLPKYLDKVRGRQVVTYPKDALSFVRDGYIHLSKTNIYVKNFVDKDCVRQVRVVPHNGYITIEIVYKKECKDRVDTEKYAAIDLGIDNLATVTSTEFSPLIVNGRPVKSMNRYYNKSIAQEKSRISHSGHNRSHIIDSMWRRRKMRINDYLHKASRLIVNHLVSHEISHLIIGYNKLWKQDANMGRVNNQRFVFVPFDRFVEMLEYKCELEGIKVELQEESYTSRASFFDDDPIPTYNPTEDSVYSFSGTRVKRGLYRTSLGKFINADVNASLNILRKYAIHVGLWGSPMRDLLIDGSHNPRRLTIAC